MKKNMFALCALLSLCLSGYAQSSSPIAPGSQPAPPLPFEGEGLSQCGAHKCAGRDEVQWTEARTPKSRDGDGSPVHRLNLGLRGGLSTLCGPSNTFLRHKVGGNGALDVQYAAYWRQKKTNVGLLVGASAGYVLTNTLLTDGFDQYTTYTDDGVIEYTISAADMTESRRQWLVEVPLMFSLIDDSGLFFNIGHRFAFPVYSRSLVSFTDGDISAYFPKEDVTVPNEVITGKVGDWRNPQQALWNAPVARIYLSTEIGYEWSLKNSDALSLGVYADYQVAEFHKAQDATHSFIAITNPSRSANPPAQVTVHSPVEHYGGNVGQLNVGLKLMYSFNFEKE